jgi:voltage-gated potassium channel
VVTMTAALVRPGLPIIARTVSPTIELRMRDFGSPTVINPFDRFGNHLRLALRAPASYQLMSWLEAGPGAALPAKGAAPTTGRWIVCGHGRFGQELTEDLRAEGLAVTVIDQRPDAGTDVEIIVGNACEPAVMARADLAHAVGLVAGTDNDVTNLSLIAAARKINPALFIAARQNRPTSAPLFGVVRADWLLVHTEMVAREIYAQLSAPLLWRFLQDMPALGDDWAAGQVDRLREHCGTHLGSVWKVTLSDREAPALKSWLRTGNARLGDLLNSPADRSRPLDAVPLLLVHDSESIVAPDDDVTVAPGDQILLVGRPAARRYLFDTMNHPAVSEYVVHGRAVASGWFWQRVTGRRPQAG